jgi:hypothetical protein
MTADEAIAYFDSLPAVRADELRGRYRGEELRTGHPMPRRLPFAMAGQKLPAWMAAAGRGLLKAFATTKHRARLRHVEHRGIVTAAMIYDHLPIIDIFKRVDDTTLLGWMDVRRQKQPYFFTLRA